MEQQIAQLYNPLFVYVKKRINNHQDAEDLTQEVFYKLSKAEFNNVKSVKHWVYTIAKNTVTDYYRRKKVNTVEVHDLPYTDEYNDEQVASELSKCVVKFVNELPEDYRQVMVLSELEGIPQKEIAERLGINYVTVRSKVQRGRKKLKALITNCCHVEQGGKGSILSYEQRASCDDNQNR